MGFTFYKPGQGKHARYVTAIFLGVIFVFGCWELYEGVGGEGEDVRVLFQVMGVNVTWGLLVVSVLFLAGLVAIAVLTCGFESNLKGLRGLGEKGRAFVDFLIDVEAELRKVAWPNRRDLFNSTWVVIVTMIAFAIFLLFMDRILQLGMTWMGSL